MLQIIIKLLEEAGLLKPTKPVDVPDHEDTLCALKEAKEQALSHNPYLSQSSEGAASMATVTLTALPNQSWTTSGGGGGTGVFATYYPPNSSVQNLGPAWSIPTQPAYQQALPQGWWSIPGQTGVQQQWPQEFQTTVLPKLDLLPKEEFSEDEITRAEKLMEELA